MAEEEFVEIDGSLLEGGGQVLRNSVSLSALLQRPIHVTKIRANRKPKSGLRAQHLAGIQVVADMYSGHLEGGYVDSTWRVFVGSFKGGHKVADTQTAGSVTLLMQVSLPCMLFGNIQTEVTFRGGTNADKAPPIDYFIKVFGPMASKFFGFEYDFKLNKRGFFPKGGGEAVLKCNPIQSLRPLVLTEQGNLTKITIYAFTAGHVAEPFGPKMTKAAENFVRKYYGSSCPQIVVECVRETNQTAVGGGGGILIVAETSTGCMFGASSLIEKNTKPEDAANKAAKELVRDIGHGGCFDEYGADQVIIFMALATGKSKIRVGPLSLHTQTAIHFVQLLSGAKFTVTPIPVADRKRKEEDSYFIECDGIGFTNPHPV